VARRSWRVRPAAVALAHGHLAQAEPVEHVERDDAEHEPLRGIAIVAHRRKTISRVPGADKAAVSRRGQIDHAPAHLDLAIVAIDTAQVRVRRVRHIARPRLRPTIVSVQAQTRLWQRAPQAVDLALARRHIDGHRGATLRACIARYPAT